MAPSRSRSLSRSPSRSRSPARRRSFSKSRSRSRSRSASRKSRSRSHSPIYKRRSNSRSRSRSRSRTRSRSRSRSSRSPMSTRKRHVGNREAPPTGKCLGVFGLSLYTTEREVRTLFEKYGKVEECRIINDRGTGRSRGFGFITMGTVADAEDAKEQLNGEKVDGRCIRVDFSITKRAHTPTPGKYLGRPDQSMGRNGRFEGGGGASNYRRGGGGYGGSSRGYRRSRSRSRSRSPYFRDRY